jgi:hypothetical protein
MYMANMWMGNKGATNGNNQTRGARFGVVKPQRQRRLALG